MEEQVEDSAQNTKRQSMENANGHKVQDVTYWIGDTKYEWSIVLWLDPSTKTIDWAESFINGKRIVMNAYVAKNGSVCIDNNNIQLCIHV